MSPSIILIRHANPSVCADERIRGRDFPDWVARYNRAGILSPTQPLPRYDAVFCSPLPRARETAALISDTLITDPHLREAALPALSFGPLRLKAAHYAALARLLWLAGLHGNGESAPAAKQRAARVAERLNSQAAKDQPVAVVAHGFINHLIGRALRRRGWQRDNARGQHDFLGQTCYRPGPIA